MLAVIIKCEARTVTILWQEVQDWRDLMCSKAILAILSIKLFTFVIVGYSKLGQYNCSYLPITKTVPSSETVVSCMSSVYTWSLPFRVPTGPVLLHPSLETEDRLVSVHKETVSTFHCRVPRQTSQCGWR